ncbi:MAG TPA: DUF488 family protein [Casimicrobiaceae bacterium]|jgi:uncharacterized protein YeaO (DUF488 family)
MKRAYEPAAAGDGARVLVDRLWPRGVRKEDAALHSWAKELAPSDALRRWFGHDPSRWDEFRRRYRSELAEKRDAVGNLRGLAREGTLTLVYGARDTEHNEAIVLRNVILGRAAN